MAGSLVSSFLSYLLLVVIAVAGGAVSITLGITLRKRKNARTEMNQETE